MTHLHLVSFKIKIPKLSTLAERSNYCREGARERGRKGGREEKQLITSWSSSSTETLCHLCSTLQPSN